jgi:homeobox protein cut-like
MIWQDAVGPSSTRSTPIPFTSSADTSILPIVTSQRDRFRQRNAELEEVSSVYVNFFSTVDPALLYFFS